MESKEFEFYQAIETTFQAESYQDRWYPKQKIELFIQPGNNGVEMASLRISSAEPEAGTPYPLIRLRDYFEQLEDVIDRETSMNMIVRVIEKEIDAAVQSAKDMQKANKMISFQIEQLFLQVVNKKENKARLTQNHVVSYDLPDGELSCVFRLLQSENEDAVGSFAVSKEIYDYHLKEYFPSKSLLYDFAVKNTSRLFPASLSSIHDLMRNPFIPSKMTNYLSQDSISMEEGDMYILTNTKNINGAAAILYPDLLKSICEKARANELMILPSSIHETLIVKKNDSFKDLAELVQTVNQSQVLPEEILSNGVFQYLYEDDCIIFHESKNEERLTEHSEISYCGTARSR